MAIRNHNTDTNRRRNSERGTGTMPFSEVLVKCQYFNTKILKDRTSPTTMRTGGFRRDGFATTTPSFGN